MYQVSIFNGSTETIIHYPSAEKDTPHLLNLPFKESLSLPDALSFLIPFNNPGYSLVNGLKTKVKVIDTRDNSIVFTGRVIPLKSNMADGAFNKEVSCEGALAYLNDSQTRRWNFTNQTPTQILTFLLNQHNSKMDSSRQIFIGIIEVTQPITIDTNFETSLNAVITKIKNILGGDIRVRETNSVLYLDYLTDQGANNGVEVKLGYNLKDMVVEYDPLDIITRAIPLGYGEGINQLDITSVNGGVEYIEDAIAKAEYGVIEGVVTNKDIQNADTLKIYGQTVLAEKKQIKLVYDISQLDLSVLTEHEGEVYNLGDTLYTLCSVMGIDVYARVVERDRDLINSPWNPTLSISTRPITLTDQIIDLKQRNLTLENAPQGSTYIDTFGYAENIDATHSFQLPIWLSPDILNVNRVRLHIDSQKFRAYEKGMGGGGAAIGTTSSGGATTSSGGGNHNHKLFNYDQFGIIVDTISPFSAGKIGGVGASIMLRTDIHEDIYTLEASGNHTHTIGNHAHTIDIPNHVHNIEYGIFEDAYPANVQIKINGSVIPGVILADGGNLDMDITSYIRIPGTTYNLEVTSANNGRVNVWVSVQAFIQAK